jgi:hypothetical protein
MNMPTAFAPTVILTLTTKDHVVSVLEKVSEEDLSSVFHVHDNDVHISTYALLCVAVDVAAKRQLAYLENREP